MDSQVGVRTVSGSLWRALSALAVPALLMQVVQTIGFLGEVYFVSRLGKVATAAVGLVGELSWLLSTLTTLVTVSTTTLVAQRWGAGDVSGARTVMRAAIAQSVLFGALAFWVWFVRHFVWQSLGADVTVRRTAEVYLLVALLTFPLMNLASGYGGDRSRSRRHADAVVHLRRCDRNAVGAERLLDTLVGNCWGGNGISGKPPCGSGAFCMALFTPSVDLRHP